MSGADRPGYRDFGRRALFGALFLFSAAQLRQDWRDRDKGLAVVLDADRSRALCREWRYPEEDLWERLRIMGVAGVILRPESLEPYIASQRVLRFTKTDIEKMRAAGISPKAPMSGNAVWVREPALLSRLLESARRRGLTLTPRRRSGLHVVDLPAASAPEKFPMGYDPSLQARLVSQGLAPVYRVSDPEDLWPEDSEGWTVPAVFLAGEASPPRGLLGARGAWVALPDREPSGPGADRRLEGAPLSRAFLAGELEGAQGVAGALKAIWLRGDRLAEYRLDMRRSLEENLSSLREILAGLRREGFHQGLPPVERDPRPLPRWDMLLRYGLALLLALTAPIFAMRRGLDLLRALQGAARWPEASPVVEVALSTACVAAVASAFGLAVYALLAGPQWRLNLFPWAWSSWAQGAPFLAGFLALYVPDVGDPADFARRVHRARSLAVLLTVAAAALIFFPPQWLATAFADSGLTGFLDRPSRWWLLDSWREFLVGYPALVVGLWAYFGHKESGAGRRERDPRPWLLLGLLAPIGTVADFVSTRLPFEEALLHVLRGVPLAFLLGLLLILATRMRRRRAKGIEG